MLCAELYIIVIAHSTYLFCSSENCVLLTHILRFSSLQAYNKRIIYTILILFSRSVLLHSITFTS